MERYRIMIVDDEQEVRQAIIRKMDWEKLGFQVVLEAENGQDALEKAESVPLDVVLTDIKMPFMDGFTMGRHLAKTHPGVKLIIFSGFDEFQYAQEAIKLNVVEYVLKPVNAEELAGILTRVKATLDEEIAKRTNIEELSAAYERSLPLLREQYFGGLLNGTLSAEEIRTGAERYEPAFRQDPYLTVAICHLEPRMGESQGVSEELLPISLKKLAQDRLGRLCRMEVMLSPPNVILLTGWDHSPRRTCCGWGRSSAPTASGPWTPPLPWASDGPVGTFPGCPWPGGTPWPPWNTGRWWAPARPSTTAT